MDRTGRAAFADEASQINQNLFSFRSDVDGLRAQNQQLKQEARTADYTQVLKSVGQEVGVRTFNELLSKYGGKAYRYKSSVGSLADIDEQLGATLTDAFTGGGKGLSNRLNRRAPQVEMNDMGVERTRTTGLGGEGTDMIGLGDEAIPLKSSMRTAVMEHAPMNPDTVHTDESFEDFMGRQTRVLPRTQSGKIDFDQASSSVYDLNQSPVDMPSEQESIGHDTHAEIGGGDALRNQSSEDRATESTFNNAVEATTEQAKSEGARLLGTGGQVVDDFTEAASRAGGAVKGAVGEGLEGVGAALDSTGILAPVGALVGAAGAALDIAGLYQVGKGVVDWFDEDILQKKAPAPPQVSLPSQPYTISQRGMGIVPNMDSLNLPSSVSSGW
tara:strand:+ start:10286 stop:11443 length:1158 start_codon:yes stop_codon:yes gene_type:complete